MWVTLSGVKNLLSETPPETTRTSFVDQVAVCLLTFWPGLHLGIGVTLARDDWPEPLSDLTELHSKLEHFLSLLSWPGGALAGDDEEDQQYKLVHQRERDWWRLISTSPVDLFYPELEITGEYQIRPGDRNCQIFPPLADLIKCWGQDSRDFRE